MIKELDRVVLTVDLPEHGLQEGDIGTVVLVHRGGEGYEVEFVALDGETVAGSHYRHPGSVPSVSMKLPMHEKLKLHNTELIYKKNEEPLRYPRHWQRAGRRSAAMQGPVDRLPMSGQRPLFRDRSNTQHFIRR